MAQTASMQPLKSLHHGLIRRPWTDILKFVAVVGVMVWLMYRSSKNMGYNWQWYRVPQYIGSFENGFQGAGPLIKGLGVTIRITLCSMVMMLVFALTAALFRLSGSVPARILARGYIEIIRNTPLLVQLFFIYFVLSPVLGIGRFTSAVLALSLFEGAYASEMFRAGIVSVHKSQWEAAYSLGFSVFQTYRWVILPQAVRRILPPLTNQIISLVKDSSLVSTIAIYDLTMQGQSIVAETYLTFEIWFVIAFVYLAICVMVSISVHRMEHYLKPEI